MNTYYMIVMHRITKEVIVILRCESEHNPPVKTLRDYAKWAGFEFHDLLYNIAPCHNMSEVYEGKDILTLRE